jgi:hypothetical protein
MLAFFACSYLLAQFQGVPAIPISNNVAFQRPPATIFNSNPIILPWPVHQKLPAAKTFGKSDKQVEFKPKGFDGSDDYILRSPFSTWKFSDDILPLTDSPLSLDLTGHVNPSKACNGKSQCLKIKPSPLSSHSVETNQNSFVVDGVPRLLRGGTIQWFRLPPEVSS